MNSYIGFPDGSSNEVQDRVWKGDVSFFLVASRSVRWLVDLGRLAVSHADLVYPEIDRTRRRW